MDLNERLRISADPIATRRMLAAEQQRPRRGRRRVIARMVSPGSETFRHWLQRQGTRAWNTTMKTITAEFTIPDVVPRGKYAGVRIADLPTEDLGFVLREQRRAPRLARAIEFELLRRKKRVPRLPRPCQ